MRIKLKTDRWSYPGGTHRYGEWVEVTPEQARQLVDSKQAEAVDPFPVVKPVEVKVEKPKTVAKKSAE